MESESFQRILQGLARSVSPDAIVNAIVEDLEPPRVPTTPSSSGCAPTHGSSRRRL